MNLRNGILHLALAPVLAAGPYSKGLDDPANVFDAPVPGFTGPHGDGRARLDDGFFVDNPDNRVNPLFFAWADAVVNYSRSDADQAFNDPSYALGPVTGDLYDVVSLGDLTAAQITAGNQPGSITLRLAKPVRDRSGADFVVFENSLLATSSTVWGELAHVEASADGVTFLRFPSASLTPSSVGGYGAVDPTNIGGLAGKHVNAEGDCWGTPFDIGALGLSQATHVRIVDIPGNGSFRDSAGRPIYDGWRTFGSGGFDLEAVGAVSVDMSYALWPELGQLAAADRGPMDDPDADGIPNLLEYAFALVPWERDAPGAGWSHTVVEDGGSLFFELTTRRDERLVDLTRSVEVSSDMRNWQAIATSVSGAPFQAAGGHAVSVAENSVSPVASIGVVRRDVVRHLSPAVPSDPRFYRLRVTRSDP